MSKQIRKYISIVLLCLFTCNTVIVYKTYTMAVPISMALQQVPRFLMTAGTCVAGLATTVWKSSRSALHTFTQPTVQSHSTTTIKPPAAEVQVNRKTETIVPSVVPDIKAVPCPVTNVETKKASKQATVKTAEHSATIEPAFAAEIQRIAREHKETLALAIPRQPITYSAAIPAKADYTIERVDSDGGVTYCLNGNEAYATFDWSGRQIQEDNARYADIVAAANFHNFHTVLHENSALCDAVTRQLKTALHCFVNMHDPDLMVCIQACCTLRSLKLLGPLSDGFYTTIGDLENLFFHRDGTLCNKGLHSPEQAADSIMRFVDWTDKHIGSAIARDQYISTREYEQLKAECSPNICVSFWKWLTASTGYYCSHTKDHKGKTEEYNKAFSHCIDLCTQFKFDEAKKLSRQYHSGLFKAVIKYYEQVQVDQEKQLHNALYDEHGIIRVAHADPLYKQYERDLQHVSIHDKSAINDNFLVRHQIKTTMQQKWNISDSAPTYVHDALYAIMGNDCSALSDVQALANRVHEIVTIAPAEQQADLIKAFYLPNGVLKEYAQHDPGVQTIKMHSSILGSKSADIRKELNELVGSRIKNNQDTVSIDDAIKSINLKLSENPQHQKPTVTPQGGGWPTPSAPDPEPDKNKKHPHQRGQSTPEKPHPNDQRYWTEEQKAEHAAKKAQGDVIRQNGKKFENKLQKQLGGCSSFRGKSLTDSREFDGAYGNIWYEAKSGNFWNNLIRTNRIGDFKSDMGRGLAIAKANGATYELHSNTPIPQIIKDWLIQQGIKFFEWL